MKLSTYAAITLRPTFPFIKWVKSSVSGTEWAEEINEIVKEKSTQDGHIYLVSPIDSEDSLEALITQSAIAWLENELMEWQIDPEFWPSHLDDGLLRRWFTISYSEMVFRSETPVDDLVDFSGSPNLKSEY